MELLASGDSDLGEASPPRYWRLGINPLAAPPRRWRAPEPARTRRRSNAGPVLKGMRQSAPPPAREGWWRGLEAAATRRVAHTWPVPEKNPLAAPPRRWRVPEPARTRRRSNAGPILKGIRQSAPPPAREGLWRGLEAAATRQVVHTWPVPEKNPLAAPPRRWRVPEPARTRRRSNAGPILKGIRQSAPPPAREGLWRGLEAAATRQVVHTWTVPNHPPPPPRPARFVVGFGGGGAPPVNFHRPGTHGANTADRAGWIYPPACRSLPPREAGIADACKRLSRRLPDLTHRWMPRLPRLRRPASPWLSLPSPWERKRKPWRGELRTPNPRFPRLGRSP